MNCIGNNRCNLDQNIDPGDSINLTHRDYINLSNTDSDKGGGGIYIVIERPIESPTILENLTFIKCKAVYGGAVGRLLASFSLVRIKSCIFNENEANKRPTTPGSLLFGGGACYLQVTDVNITNCIFKKNIGSGVKIYDINGQYSSSSKLLLTTKGEIDSSISIEGCIFEIDKVSSSSLFLIRGENKQQTPIEIKDCTFVGDLSKGAHHIDGTSLLNEKTNNEESKLRIKSCRFSSDIENAVNSKKHPLLFASFDSDSQSFNFTDNIKSELTNEIVLPKKNINKKKFGENVIAITTASVFVILIIVAVIILKKNNGSLENILDTEDNFEVQKNVL